MSILKLQGRTRAQESSGAIERMYITMRHLLTEVFINQWVFQEKLLENHYLL